MKTPLIPILLPIILVAVAPQTGAAAGTTQANEKTTSGQAIAQRSFREDARQTLIARSTSQPLRNANGRGSAPKNQQLELARLERTQRYRPLIDYYSKLNRIEPELVSAVIYAESGGDPKAVSRQGAAGLMQLMPNTAHSLGVEDRYDAEQNIASGTKYLSRLVERFGSTELALWAYNAGPAAVKAGRMPAETEDYVPQVMRLAKVFKNLAK